MKKIILILLLIPVFAFGQKFTDKEKEIILLQDSRSLGKDNVLIKYITVSDEKTAIRALTALANIGDSTTVKDIGKVLLKSQNASIRATAAFALGQIPCRNSVSLLEKALAKEKNVTVLCDVFNALGKTGNERSLDKISAYTTQDTVLQSNIALAIGRFAVRRIFNSKSISALKSLIQSGNETVKRNAAYCLMRTRQRDLMMQIKEEIKGLTLSADDNTRMWGFAAFGYVADSTDFEYILSSLKNETVWQVKVNILYSLNVYKISKENYLNDGVIDLFLNELIKDANPNVRITALAAAGNIYSAINSSEPKLLRIKNALAEYFSESFSAGATERAQAIDSYSKIFKEKIFLMQRFSETENYDIKSAIVKSFRYYDNALVYKEVKDSIFADVQRYNSTHKVRYDKMIQNQELAKLYKAFVELLTNLDKRVDATNQNLIRLIYSEFSSSKDVGLVDLSFSALRDSIYTKYRSETAMVMTFDYKELKLPEDFDVMMMFVNMFKELKSKSAVEILEKNLNSNSPELAKASASALKEITGKDYEIKENKKPKTNKIDFQLLSKNLYVKFKTTAGDFKIRLFTNAVPLSSLNFYKLSEKGFYNGTLFHRVVPNFVIQGGDRSNSGSGSAGYMIRTEIAPDISFERGFVGMASDGKDTEGSQFFVMHSPHYHLDGRYTVFGILIEGFDVVDNVSQDTAIISTEVTAE